MSKSDFIPSRDGDLDAYEQNFANKLLVHIDELAIDPEEVTEINNIINEHRTAYSTVISKRAESKSATEVNETKKEKAIKELRRVAQMVKSRPKYTKAIGDALQIIAPVRPLKDVTMLKPVISIKLNGQEVRLKFTKDQAVGVKIYSKRGNEAEFQFLAIGTQSPFIDNRPKLNNSKPEQREYYVVLFENVQELGMRSDIVRATIP